MAVHLHFLSSEDFDKLLIVGLMIVFGVMCNQTVELIGIAGHRKIEDYSAKIDQIHFDWNAIGARRS
jgi:hypothetical protein